MKTIALLASLFLVGCQVTTTGGGAGPAAPSGGVAEGGGHSIEGTAVLANDAEIAGHWFSESWGDMAFRVEPNGMLRGAYTHDAGTVYGHYEQGVFRGTWTERSRKGDDDSGEVEFRFVKVADGSIHIDGRWCFGHSKEWKDDWDMNKQTTPAPADLVTRLDDKSAYP